MYDMNLTSRLSIVGDVNRSDDPKGNQLITDN
jgi:hypothetical protein